jgi:hypothetical protein
MIYFWGYIKHSLPFTICYSDPNGIEHPFCFSTTAYLIVPKLVFYCIT